MSIIDNLLVLLDDDSFMTIEDIERSFPQYSKQIISASLGRIASKNYIKKNKSQYKILPDGQNIITKNLDRIKIFEKRPENNDLLFVIFNIPEKERLYRDILRNYMTQNGFGRLHNTVWVSLHHDEYHLEQFLSELKIKDKVLVYRSKISDDYLKTLFKHINWNDTKLNTMYKEFTKNTTKFFNSNSKSKIMARCMVYEFSKIISYDPILPANFINKKYEGLNAFAKCQKLRKYCY